MNRDKFWEIVERLHRRAGSNMDKKCKLLEAVLTKLPPKEIASWDKHFWQLMTKAYSHQVRGVATLYGESSSYDSFQDFRSTLISCGRTLFERVCADADSLADYRGKAFLIAEGYQYVASAVYERLTGEEIPRDLGGPSRPSGKDWKAADLPKRFPRTAARWPL